MAKRANDRHWHVAVPVLIGAVALAVMPVFMSGVAWAAFVCLSIGTFGMWAGHGPFMSWPAVILSGTNAASGEPLRSDILPSSCSAPNHAPNERLATMLCKSGAARRHGQLALTEPFGISFFIFHTYSVAWAVAIVSHVVSMQFVAVMVTNIIRRQADISVGCRVCSNKDDGVSGKLCGALPHRRDLRHLRQLHACHADAGRLPAGRSCHAAALP